MDPAASRPHGRIRLRRGVNAPGAVRRPRAAVGAACFLPNTAEPGGAGCRRGSVVSPKRTPDKNDPRRPMVRSFCAAVRKRTACEHRSPWPSARHRRRAPAERLRALPSVDRLATSVARAVLAERRAELLAAPRRRATPTWSRAPAGGCAPSLRRVLNATGVIVHTNLGRAPLADDGARGGRARGARATRTSSRPRRRASAARATTTSRRCCAS